MASTIIIKNGAGSSTPSSLKQGELAINVDNGKLFYGTSGSSNAVSSSFSFQHITASGNIIVDDGSNKPTTINSNGIDFNPEANGSGVQFKVDDANAKTTISGLVEFELSSNRIELGTNANHHVTASGHISASGTGSFRALNITDDGVAKFNVDTNGHVTASGTGSFTGGVESTTTGSFGHLFVNGTINIPVIGNDPAGIIQVNGVNYISGTTNDLNVGNTSKILDLRGTNVMITGSISASGDISSSGGTVTAKQLTLDDASRVDIKFTNVGDEDHYIRKDGNFLRFRGHDDSTVLLELRNNTDGSNKTSFPNGNHGIGTNDPGEKLEVVGNISASGTLAGTALTLATNGVNVATIDTSGNISSSAALFGTGLNLRQTGVHKVSLNPEGNGNIAAEGFISSSGALSGTSLTLATNGATRAAIDASGEIVVGALSSSGVLNANTVQLAHNGINTLNISNAGAVSASSTIQGTAFTAQTNGVTTATIDASGNISSSGGTITTSTLVGHGTTTEFAVNGDISSSATLLGTDLDIRSAGVQKAFIDTDGTGSFTHISASQLFIHDTDAGGGIHLFDNDGNNIAAFARVGSGTNAHKGRMVLRDNADIKVEITSTGTSFVTGDFSSSAALKGNTAQFANNGVDTLNISNAGAISASSTIQGTAFTAQTNGATKATIGASGEIAAEGNISSSAALLGTRLTLTTAGVHKASISPDGEIAAEGFISSSGLLSGTSLDIRSAGVQKTSIDTSGNVSASQYVNQDIVLSNQVVFFSNPERNELTMGNTNHGFDSDTIGGIIEVDDSPASITIAGNEAHGGMIVPFDITQIDLKAYYRPAQSSGTAPFNGTSTSGAINSGDDMTFEIHIYESDRPDANNSNITLTRIGVASDTLAAGALNKHFYTCDLSEPIAATVSAGKLLHVAFEFSSADASVSSMTGNVKVSYILTAKRV